MASVAIDEKSALVSGILQMISQQQLHSNLRNYCSY